MGDFEVVVGAGSLRSADSGAASFPHPWTDAGVTVDTVFSGAHLLHLATAGCVLNDVYREAQTIGVPVDGVRVTADGGYDTSIWASTGIEYRVEVDSPASASDLAGLLARVEAVAEIPQVLRQSTTVRRSD